MGFISGEYGDSFCDLIEVQSHCLRVDVRQDQPYGSTTGGTSGTEDIAPLVTLITRCAGAGYALHPFARKCSLLPTRASSWNHASRGLPFACSGMSLTTRLAKFLKACCAAGSVLGCSGRTEKRKNPCLARYLSIVRSCNFTLNTSSTRACKSAQRHCTTLSSIGLGPAST